jgi:hypothetical protein
MVPVAALLRREGMPMDEHEQPRANTADTTDSPARRRLLGVAAGAAFVVGSFAAGAVVLTGSEGPSDQSTDARSTALPGVPEAPQPAPAEARQQPDQGATAPIAPVLHSAPTGAGAGDTSSTRVDPPRQAAPPAAARPAPPPPARPAPPPPAPAPQQPAPQQPGPLQQTLAPVTNTVDNTVGAVTDTVGGLVPALSMIDNPLGGLLGG